MKYYFETPESELCYPLSYFQQHLQQSGKKHIQLIEAKVIEEKDMFWCHIHQAAGAKDEPACGKICPHYQPRNGISGCCKNYSTRLFEPTNKTITITKTE